MRIPDMAGFSPHQQPSAAVPADGKAVASLVLGVCGLVMWPCPFIGFAVTIPGLILGTKSNNARRSGMAKAGIILCLIGLLLTSLNAAWGAYLGVTGQNPWIDPPSETRPVDAPAAEEP